MSDTTIDLQEALEELQNYAHDVQQSSDLIDTNAIRRYVSRLDKDPIASIASRVLPLVDFDSWYEKACKSVGARGSGNLDWPDDDRRLTLWTELLRKIARGQIGLASHIDTFHYYEAGQPHIGLQKFVSQDFMPFHRDFIRLVRRESGVQVGTTLSGNTVHIGYIIGDNTRFNQNSVDQSVNITHQRQDIDALIDALRQEVNRCIQDEAERSNAQEIVAAIEEQCKSDSTKHAVVSVLLNSLSAFGNISSIGSLILSWITQHS